MDVILGRLSSVADHLLANAMDTASKARILALSSQVGFPKHQEQVQYSSDDPEPMSSRHVAGSRKLASRHEHQAWRGRPSESLAALACAS